MNIFHSPKANGQKPKKEALRSKQRKAHRAAKKRKLEQRKGESYHRSFRGYCKRYHIKQIMIHGKIFIYTCKPASKRAISKAYKEGNMNDFRYTIPH